MFIVFEFNCYKFRSPSREFTLYITSVKGLTKQNQCEFSENEYSIPIKVCVSKP